MGKGLVMTLRRLVAYRRARIMFCQVHKQVLLVSVTLLLTGCFFFLLSPTTYRCPEPIPGFSETFLEMTREGSYEKPSRALLFRGVQPGMMREQVRFIFDELRQDHPEIAKGVILDDSDAEFLYFLAGTCPELRYRFENNRLVSAGYLTGEFGFWNYYGPDFTKPDCNIVETKPGDFHWFRTIPKYDQHGHFIGREDIDDGPLSEASRRSLLLLMEGKMSDVPSDSPDYCKGMEAE